MDLTFQDRFKIGLKFTTGNLDVDTQIEPFSFFQFLLYPAAGWIQIQKRGTKPHQIYGWFTNSQCPFPPYSNLKEKKALAKKTGIQLVIIKPKDLAENSEKV